MAKKSTVRRLPRSERAINAFTNGGATELKPEKKVKKVEKKPVAEPVNEPVGKQQRVPLRLYPDIVDEVDMLLQYRRRKTSRNAWILEAIEEKIKREKKDYRIS